MYMVSNLEYLTSTELEYLTSTEPNIIMELL